MIAMYHHRATHYDETKKGLITDRSSSNGGLNQTHAPGTNQLIKALRQGRHRVKGLTHRRAIQEETIAINCDWVYKKDMLTVRL